MFTTKLARKHQNTYVFMVAFSVHQQNSPRMVAKLKPCGVGLFDRKKNRGQAKNPAQKPFFARKLQIWSLHRNSKPFTSIDSTSKSFTSVTKWPVLIFWIFKSSSLTWLWLFSGSICAKRLSWRFSHHKKSDRCWKKQKQKRLNFHFVLCLICGDVFSEDAGKQPLRH